MKWKAIGQKATGTSHFTSNKSCEDSIAYNCFSAYDEEILVCIASDGAGSAKYAAEASAFVTEYCLSQITSKIYAHHTVYESDVLIIVENLYNELKNRAFEKNENLNEFSCTLLGAVLFSNRAIFFQIGDGAIVRNDGLGHYVSIWWPQNGEYQNTTTFLVDDESMSNFKIKEIEETINEISIFTDGIQLLALNIENENVHQPFFENVFSPLRMADDPQKIELLNNKLIDYLNSNSINQRTDDDKTLFLASRL